MENHLTSPVKSIIKNLPNDRVYDCLLHNGGNGVKVCKSNELSQEDLDSISLKFEPIIFGDKIALDFNIMSPIISNKTQKGE